MAGGRHYKRQPKATEEEKAARLETLDSHNYRDVKQKRINMAFTPSNYDYISAMAKLCGMTLTQFVNEALERDRIRNQDTYDKVRDFRASLK